MVLWLSKFFDKVFILWLNFYIHDISFGHIAIKQWLPFNKLSFASTEIFWTTQSEVNKVMGLSSGIDQII